MSAAEGVIDTNVRLYLLSADEDKSHRAEKRLLSAGVVSVQVLNVFVSVATRKLRRSIPERQQVLATVRAAYSVVPSDEATHDKGLKPAQQYVLSVYDAMIAASALDCGCKTLVFDHTQDRQIIERQLMIRAASR